MSSTSASGGVSALMDCWEVLARAVGPEYILSETYSAIHSVLFDAVGTDSVELKLAGNQPKLRTNRLQDKDVEVLYRAVEKFPTMPHTLDLSYNPITDATITYILTHLQNENCGLSSLNLSYTDVSGEGVESLCGILQLNKSVTVLQLNGVKMGRRGGISVASMLQVNPLIHTLGLAAADLDTDSIIAMATVLQANKSLRRVDLSRPLLFSLQEETSVHLSRMFKVNSTLQELHLAGFCMSDTGAEWLCRGLHENHSLTWLNISKNKLSRDSARHFATLLAKNPPLQTLDFSSNRIEDEGLQHLSKALATNSNLTRLSVCNNSIGDPGLCALAATLSSTNLCLSKVTIWGNNIGEPTSNAFFELLHTKRLSPENVDVEPYRVDGVNYLSLKDLIE